MNAPSTQIVEFNEFEANLAEYKKRYVGVVYDFTDSAQEKQARSDRLAIGKTVAELDRVHKAVKAPLAEKVSLLDGERKRIKDGLLEVQDGIKQQIARHEAELQAIEDALATRVQAIKDLAEIDEHSSTSDQVRAALQEAHGVSVDDSFQHHEANAALAKSKAVEALGEILARVEAREQQEAELARVKAELAAKEQAERDERIAREAREAAEREAEQAKAREAAAAERARQAEIAAAEAAKQAEIDKAAAVEQARKDAERRQQEAKAQEDAEIARREANTQHKGRCNREAAEDIATAAGITEAQAQKIVKAIVKGGVRHIKINY